MCVSFVKMLLLVSVVRREPGERRHSEVCEVQKSEMVKSKKRENCWFLLCFNYPAWRAGGRVRPEQEIGCTITVRLLSERSGAAK